MDKDKLQLFQKYVDILDLAKDAARPTLASDAVLKRVKELDIDPKDWESLKIAFQDYSTRGKTYLDAQNYEDAIEELEIAESLNPNDDKTLLALAQAHAGKWQKRHGSTNKRKAIEYGERVLRVKPDSKQAVRIITELKNAPFQPWIPYKTWWLMARVLLFLVVVGGGYWTYNKYKNSINASLSQMAAREDRNLFNFDLNKITFAAGSYELNPQSIIQLDKLAAYLRKHRTVEGEIACHTDNSGDRLGNKQISEVRAKVIYEYLVGKQVPAAQLTYRGYGDAHPLLPNTTEENRQKNRRVEFIIRKQ